MPPPSGMCRILLVVLLVSAALQGSAATAGGGWLNWFQGRLDVVQQQVQQRQAGYLQQQQQRLATAAADSVPEPAQRRLMQEVEAADTGSYGYGSYGYGPYGGYSTGSSSSRRRLQENPGLAPTLVYHDDDQIQQVRQIGEAHTEGIELGADAPVLPPTLHERPVEIRAARKLLLTASDINVAVIEQAVLPVAPIVLEPEDVLASHSRSLLQDVDLAGGYGGYGYGYGYGGYGAEPSGRSLLEAGDVDDVQLYNIWLQKHLQQRKH